METLLILLSQKLYMPLLDMVSFLKLEAPCDIHEIENYELCLNIKDCDYCVANPHCGWCEASNTCFPGNAEYASCA